MDNVLRVSRRKKKGSWNEGHYVRIIQKAALRVLENFIWRGNIRLKATLYTVVRYVNVRCSYHVAAYLSRAYHASHVLPLFE